MSDYLQDLVQNIYTNCDMSGFDDYNKAMKNLTKQDKQSIRDRMSLYEREEKLKVRLRDYEDKYATKKAKRDAQDLSRMRQHNGLVRAGMRLLGAYLSIRTLENVINTGSKLQLIQKSIEGLTKSTQDWQFIEQLAFNMGVSLETAAKGYRNFYSAANMAGFGKGDIQGMYADLMLATRSIGASQQQTEGALLALEQMISKGKVSMEELRRQLGNAIPGAFEIGAKAMNMTTMQFNEFVKTGSLASAEFVPKFIKTLKETYAGGWADVAETVSVAQGRLKVAWEKLTLEMMSGDTGKAFAQGINALAELINSNDFKKLVQILGVIFKWCVQILQVVIKIINFLLANLTTVLALLGGTGLYGLMIKLGVAQKMLNANIAVGIKWMKIFGIESVKSFMAATKGALVFSARIMGILSWVLILQDVLLYIVGLLTGQEIDTMTGRLASQGSDIIENQKNLSIDPLRHDFATDYLKMTDPKFERAMKEPWKPENAKYIKQTIEKNKKPGGVYERPDYGGATGFAAPMFNKEEDTTNNVTIGDINIYANSNNPSEIGQIVQNHLISIFTSQGLSNNIEGTLSYGK